MTQAVPNQQALCFARAHELGDDAATVKARAKQHFDLASFNDLTTQQLSELIERLQARRAQASASDHAAHG